MFDNIDAWLPGVNAALIVTSGLFLLLGFWFIRHKQVARHRGSMLTATVFAALFLVVYVTRAILLPTKFFPEQGAIRTVYLVLLVSHIIVAILVGPFAIYTLRQAFTLRFDRHKRIARITLPIWLYTAVTGWIVYLMLYAPWWNR